MINPIYEQLFREGYMIVAKEMEHDCEHYTVWGLMKSGDNPPKEWYSDYSLVIKAGTELISEIRGPIEVGFSVLVLYNRGLGRESISLDPIRDTTLTGAKEKAQRQAEEHFCKTPGFEKAKLIEVCVRPVMLA